jgi:hypothetical protein
MCLGQLKIAIGDGVAQHPQARRRGFAAQLPDLIELQPAPVRDLLASQAVHEQPIEMHGGDAGQVIGPLLRLTGKSPIELVDARAEATGTPAICSLLSIIPPMLSLSSIFGQAVSAHAGAEAIAACTRVFLMKRVRHASLGQYLRPGRRPTGAQLLMPLGGLLADQRIEILLAPPVDVFGPDLVEQHGMAGLAFDLGHFERPRMAPANPSAS